MTDQSHAAIRRDDPAILEYARNIIDAPDEWTPNYTRAELLPMARAYVAAADQPDESTCDHHWIDEPQIVCAHCGAFQ